ncbi:HpcH/HpaI aldolase/citrate lyase family protein [Candidimonas nitroreducens]|uniref:CoA ester lyase n=1 Tax=Candidimonas nitroreducens TaxID=683354 RepID=A0A225MFP1_9BURK|nr:CoA ester lyase [Candidimonas nitroreducens]OWT60074.1 CoA ester lyase [Candidimonas nitroreducens]
MSASMLFVPASSPEKFAKACNGDAHALILDLEDSVPPDGKDQARGNVIQMLRSKASSQQLWVRVNPAESGLLLQDLAAVVPHAPYGIVLPKCCGRDSLFPVACYLDALEAAAGIAIGQTRILAIATETAASLFRLADYAGVTARLWGLAWGGEDLGADMGVINNSESGVYTDPFRLARSLCVLGAAAAGVRAIDTVTVALKDIERVRREALAAFRDGFSGKMAIHPAQIEAINQAFTFSPEKIEWARRVLAAFAQNPGQRALQLDGQMIDEPHAKQARRILEASR